MNKTNGHIFISYAREDRGRVAILAKLLADEGWSVWWDRDNLPAGQKFQQVIARAIQDASCVLVCWSEAAIDSDWVIDEANEAKKKNKFLPVLLEAVEVPFGFRGYHYIDLTKWDDKASHAAYQRLKSELTKIQPLTKLDVSTQQPAKSKISKPEPVNVQKPVDRLDKPSSQPEDKPVKLPLKKNVRAKLTPFVITFVVMAAIGILYAITYEPVQPKPVQPKSVLPVQLASILPDMVTIKKGSLKLPAENGETSRILKVDQAFEMGKYEVTFAEYDYYVSDVLKVDKYGLLVLPKDMLVLPKAKWGRGKYPVINVTWFDAVAYAQWLSEKTGKLCTLPTENQWEYAARAGSTKKYGIPAETGGSDDITGKDLANCAGCESGEKIEKTTEVGSFKANAWGLYDMHGNVWEWNLNEYYKPENTSLEGNKGRVLRGGSWNYNPDFARASVRHRFVSDFRDLYIGFRVVCSSSIPH